MPIEKNKNFNNKISGMMLGTSDKI